MPGAVPPHTGTDLALKINDPLPGDIQSPGKRRKGIPYHPGGAPIHELANLAVRGHLTAGNLPDDPVDLFVRGGT